MPKTTTTFHSEEYIPLSGGTLALIDVMPHPSCGVSADLAVVNAARVSFLGESKGDAADKKLLFYLMRNRHTSPFEQVVLKFRVRAPLITWWQWVRHRTWSFNFQSGRYTEFDECDFYVPDVWRRQSASNKQASDGEVDSDISYTMQDALMDHTTTGYQLYRSAIESGVAREMARLFLPGFAVFYEAIATVDAHNLMQFIRLRDHEHAQHEIRVYAQAMREIMREIMPWTMEAFDETCRKEKNI